MEFFSGSHIPFFELDVSARIESAALPLLPPALPRLPPALPRLHVLSLALFLCFLPFSLALVVGRSFFERADFVEDLVLHLLGLRARQLKIHEALDEEYQMFL